MDSNPSKAVTLFQQAVDKAPSNADAQFGLGYARLKSGDAQGAKTHLCQALSTGSGGTVAEVRGVLGNAGLTCD